MESIFSLENLKILIAVISLFFGIWQYSQKRKTRKIISLEAVELHKNIAVALGATQAAKNAITNRLSPDFEIGRAEGMCQAILYESAKLYCNLSDTKLDDIDDLISAGQLNNNYKDIYYSFSDRKRGFISKCLKKLKIIF